MEKIKKLYDESFLAYAVSVIVYQFIPMLKEAFFSSFIWCVWLWFDKYILNSKIVKIFFDPNYLSGIWYRSYFYRKVTYRIRKLSFYLPKASIKYDSIFLGIFIAVILLTPDNMWSDLFWMPLFAASALFYISRNIKERTGTIFTMTSVVLILFLILLEFALPYNAVKSLVYLLIGIDLFFLISFSIRTLNDLEKILACIFVSASVLCGIGFIQNTVFSLAASAVFKDGVSFGEILALMFPFTFVYALNFKKNPRKILYTGFIFISFLNVIIATRSKAAFIGFAVELAILIFTDLRYFPFLLMLIPFGLGSIAENLRMTWHATTSYGNVINNIINLFRRIWNFGFGVNSQKFLDIYNSANFNTADEVSMIKLPYVKISPVYINFLIDIGAAFMIGFLMYIVRLAHSALTLLFTAEKKYRQLFAAGLATLVGISVSSFFETTIFASRTMLIYWVMLGILRSVRIMSFGVYES